jgi:hypothetical protein
MKTLIATILAVASCALGQQTVQPQSTTTGYGTPPSGNCSGIQNVGWTYDQLGNPTNGGQAGTHWVCEQTGAAASGGAIGGFGWVAIPATVVNNCGTANACSATNISLPSKIVVGITAALNGASPAVAAVTAMPAFTSSTSYVCTANVNSASASTHVLAVNYVSATAVTFTGANGSTDTVSFICIGS